MDLHVCYSMMEIDGIDVKSFEFLNDAFNYDALFINLTEENRCNMCPQSNVWSV
jgi:hypothetical protein